RLEAGDTLKAALEDGDCLVIDSDSRLTQLGLLPVCEEPCYHLFESRCYGAETDLPLPQLAAQWARETLGIAETKPFVALGHAAARGCHIAVSLGVGENPAKRLPDPFEEELLRLLAGSGMPLCIDMGAGGEEAERVRGAVERAGIEARLWQGSFAGFASIIAASRLFVGYDSAGQHVAAACGIPLISIFCGFPVSRMFDRWRPTGTKTIVLRVDHPDPAESIARVRDALSALL
ncbi:MAG TPA: glycosyltransferase family 9 protein, partial [Rhizomicrobium sp.]|nr:glycosyltransferase family 9 protein [Rhizomicrobium sp.]